MSMRRALWRREGLLLRPKPDHPWWMSHAQIPTVLPFSDRLWRVYFSARNGANRASILAVDLDPTNDMEVLAEYLDPLLDLGLPGSFDHEGMAPSAALAVNGQIRLYYSGVAVRKDVRAQYAAGVALSEDGLKFRKAFAGPVLATGPRDPFFSTAPVVIRIAGGFRVWYVGGVGWELIAGDLDFLYEIRTTRSCDGFFWDQHSKIAVPLDKPKEAGFGRPWITRDDSGLRLWYSRRGKSYRGNANGAYRLASVRVDEQGECRGAAEAVQFENPPEPGDFDASMQAYASIAPLGDDLIMFYNGDEFGKAGFGWARLAGGATRR